MSEPFPQQPQQPPTGPVPGSLLERFVARLLDGLIVGIPLAIVLVIIFGILGIAGDTIGSILMSALIGVAQFAYMVYFESTTGQTIGKKVIASASSMPRARCRPRRRRSSATSGWGSASSPVSRSWAS